MKLFSVRNPKRVCWYLHRFICLLFRRGTRKESDIQLYQQASHAPGDSVYDAFEHQTIAHSPTRPFLYDVKPAEEEDFCQECITEQAAKSNQCFEKEQPESEALPTDLSAQSRRVKSALDSSTPDVSSSQCDKSLPDSLSQCTECDRTARPSRPGTNQLLPTEHRTIQHALTVVQLSPAARKKLIDDELKRSESRLTRISMSIVWLFIFCHCWRLIPTIYEGVQNHYYQQQSAAKRQPWPVWVSAINDLSHTLIVLNSAINFLIYAFS